MKRELYNICVLLLKKAITLNNCNEVHLDQGNNVYYLNKYYFQQIRRNSVYNDVKGIFKNDKDRLKGYLELIL